MIVLHENVLTDDYVERGVLHYFTYATEWSDHEHIKEFNTTAEALEWYENNFHERVVAQGEYWIAEADGVGGDITEEEAVGEWEDLTYGCIED